MCGQLCMPTATRAEPARTAQHGPRHREGGSRRSPLHPPARSKQKEVRALLLLLVVHLLAAAQLASAARSDEADLLAGHAVAAHGRRMTDVLVVTTTVGVLDGVHRDATRLGPRVALGLVLVEGAAGLEHRLVDTATARDNANGSACQ